MDNATAQPQDLDDDLPDGSDFLKVKFLPPNTIHLFQPMDQQVISNYKMLYARALFRKNFEVTNDTQLNLGEFWKGQFTILNCLTLNDNVWTDVTLRTLNSGLKNLCPNSVADPRS